MAKYYPPAIEAFQINNNDNTEMIEYFQKTIPDFDILHGTLDSPHWQGAIIANGAFYHFQYGDWVAEVPDSFYGVEIISNDRFCNYKPDEALEYD